MKIIFLTNVKGVALAGDIKDVSSGYARNYLIPRRIARLATKDAHMQSEALKKKRELSKEKLESWAKEGHLYGSVDEKALTNELNKLGVNVSENHILLSQPLKDAGEHEVELGLTHDIKTKVKVHIHSDTEKKEQPKIPQRGIFD
jgi:large subunit ribosomal protein L9